MIVKLPTRLVKGRANSLDSNKYRFPNDLPINIS